MLLYQFQRKNIGCRRNLLQSRKLYRFHLQQKSTGTHGGCISTSDIILVLTSFLGGSTVEDHNILKKVVHNQEDRVKAASYWIDYNVNFLNSKWDCKDDVFKSMRHVFKYKLCIAAHFYDITLDNFDGEKIAPIL